jgi:hypothetical protein
MEILQILKANNVPLNRMVDVRLDPVLRQQIHAVVRRAAAQQSQAAPTAVDYSAATAGSVATSPESTISQRLQELEALHDSGAVTDEEYTSKRTQIIADI